MLKLSGDKTRGWGKAFQVSAWGFLLRDGCSRVLRGEDSRAAREELSLWGLIKWKPWLTGGDEAKSLFLPQYSPGLFRG